MEMRTILKIIMFLVLLATVVGVVYFVWRMAHASVGEGVGE
jgi:hypothetical protein